MQEIRISTIRISTIINNRNCRHNKILSQNRPLIEVITSIVMPEHPPLTIKSEKECAILAMECCIAAL